MASLMSLRARSVSVSRRNWTVVLEMPSVTTDRMWRTPSTPDTASSTVLVTCDSSSAGAAPNCVMVTEMTGMSTLGRRVIGSLLNDTQPRNMTTIAITIAGSGWLIDHADTLRAIQLSRAGPLAGDAQGACSS